MDPVSPKVDIGATNGTTPICPGSGRTQEPVEAYRRLIGGCTNCHAPLWESWNQKERLEFACTVDSLRSVGVGLRRWLGMIVCSKCETQTEQEWETRKLEKDVSGLIEAGRLPETILDYRVPWSMIQEENPTAYDTAVNWHFYRGNLFFWGLEGTGKTALMRYLLVREIESGNKSVAEIPAMAFLDRDQKRLQQMRGVRVALLDDISAPNFYPSSMDQLRAFLDYRATNALRTLVTSNIEPSKLLERWVKIDPDNRANPESLLRRLRPVKVVHLTGKSLRESMEYDG